MWADKQLYICIGYSVGYPLRILLGLWPDSTNAIPPAVAPYAIPLYAVSSYNSIDRVNLRKKTAILKMIGTSSILTIILKV